MSLSCIQRYRARQFNGSDPGSHNTSVTKPCCRSHTTSLRKLCSSNSHARNTNLTSPTEHFTCEPPCSQTIANVPRSFNCNTSVSSRPHYNLFTHHLQNSHFIKAALLDLRHAQGKYLESVGKLTPNHGTGMQFLKGQPLSRKHQPRPSAQNGLVLLLNVPRTNGS